MLINELFQKEKEFREYQREFYKEKQILFEKIKQFLGQKMFSPYMDSIKVNMEPLLLNYYFDSDNNEHVFKGKNFSTIKNSNWRNNIIIDEDNIYFYDKNDNKLSLLLFNTENERNLFKLEYYI